MLLGGAKLGSRRTGGRTKRRSPQDGNQNEQRWHLSAALGRFITHLLCHYWRRQGVHYSDKRSVNVAAASACSVDLASCLTHNDLRKTAASTPDSVGRLVSAAATRFNRAHHMISELKEIETRARAELTAIEDEESLEKWRVAYLGRKGSLTLLLRGLTDLPLEERRSAGAAANRLKNELEEALAAQRATIDDRTLTAITTGRIDVTLPGRPQRVGRLHPVTQTLRDVLAAFVAMGFSIVEGPEVESDYYNFEALRIPKDHPARDTMDSLYIESPVTANTDSPAHPYLSQSGAGDGEDEAPHPHRCARPLLPQRGD